MLELNQALLQLRDAICPPWKVLAPGEEVQPMQERDNDAMSQAPTRDVSRQPSMQPPPAVPLPQAVRPATPAPRRKPRRPLPSVRPRPDDAEQERLLRGERQPEKARQDKLRGERQPEKARQDKLRGERQPEKSRQDKRKRPTARSLSPPRRIGPARYAATHMDGTFGLIDDGQDAMGNRILILHSSRHAERLLSLRQGDLIPARSRLACSKPALAC